MIHNSIVVFVENSQVVHKFCSSNVAKSILREATNNHSDTSWFEFDVDDAEMIFQCSPQIRQRVERAKDKLRDGMRINAAFDKHGVPADAELRSKFMAAFRELFDSSTIEGIKLNGLFSA